MKRTSLCTAGFVVVLMVSSAAWGHFQIFVPERPATRPDVPIRLYYEFGHPFEHEMLLTEKPRKIEVFPPSGDRKRLEARLEDSGGAPPASGASSGDASGSDGDSKPALRWVATYNPDERGDHILIAEAEPRYEENADEVVEDHVKTIVHVLSQNGWERTVGQLLEIVPLTRPYGIRPGWTVRFQVLLSGVPVEGGMVEVERLNEAPPKPPLPEDEFVTRTSKTAADGTVGATLDESGWWGISVSATRGTAEAPDGHPCPRVVRSTLWIYVGEPLRTSEREP